jgi:hypothetical protein
MSSCAGVAPFKPIACGGAFERLRVPGDLRQRDRVVPQVARSVLPPNRRLQLTPLRGERDRGFFESWFRLDTHTDLSMRRN